MNMLNLIVASGWTGLTIAGIIGWCLGWETPSWFTYVVMTSCLSFMNWCDWWRYRNGIK